MAAHPSVDRQRGEDVGQPRPARRAQLEVELEQPDEDEAPALQLGVRHAQARGGVLARAEEQQVDVDLPRPVARRVPEPAAELALDGLGRVEQRLGLERGGDPHARVQERGLVEDRADRRRLVDRRGRLDGHPARGQGVDRGLQTGAPVAEVRAQAEVAGHRPLRVVSSASWRLWARSTPSRLQSSPSSSKNPPAAVRE